MAVVLSNQHVGFQMLLLSPCSYLPTGCQHAACELAPLWDLTLWVTGFGYGQGHCRHRGPMGTRSQTRAPFLL